MSEKRKAALMKYGITTLVCLAMTGAVLLSSGFGTLEAHDRVRILSDAFFLPGILCVLSGLMVWCAQEGAMDGISYIMQRLFRSLIPGARLQERQTYLEFVQERREKKKAPFGFLLIVGSGFLAVSAVFLVLFHC